MSSGVSEVLIYITEAVVQESEPPSRPVTVLNVNASEFVPVNSSPVSRHMDVADDAVSYGRSSRFLDQLPSAAASMEAVDSAVAVDGQLREIFMDILAEAQAKLSTSCGAFGIDISDPTVRNTLLAQSWQHCGCKWEIS